MPVHVRLGLLQHDLRQAARPLPALAQGQAAGGTAALGMIFQSVLLSSGDLSAGFSCWGFQLSLHGGTLWPVFVPQITLYSMYVAIMAFNAKVSDPLIGGTYMTLLNTVSNLGGNWPSTVALWLVDPLTMKECAGAQGHTCATAAAAEVSLGAGGGGLCSMSQLNCFLWCFFAFENLHNV